MSYVRMRTFDGVPLAWRGGCPLFTIASSDAQIAAALQDARHAWEDAGCAQLPIDVVGTAAGGDVGYDGRNLVLWRPADYCADAAHDGDEVCLAPNAAAVTTAFFYQTGDRAGEVVETDVEVNGAFAFGTDGAPDRVDLISAITHELGHVIGLDHTCQTVPGQAPPVDSSGAVVPPCIPLEAVPAEARAATMFPFLEPGQLDARTPLSDERTAVCDLYRAHSQRCANVGPGCGCHTTNAADPLLIAALALALRGLRPRRFTSSRAGTR
jgi:MYXO-CTERM domain-containing protein